MNSLMQIPIIYNKKRWYFLSIFYAREKWNKLIQEILHFREERQDRFCHCLLFFSKERGEHIQVAFASSVDDDNSFTDEVQTWFQSFLDQNPSTSKTPFPYGKALWCNYPNNSLIWNKFRLPEYSEQYIGFHQQTIELVLKLLDDDFSEDNFFSLGIYLLTKALCCIDSQEQRNVLSLALQEASGNSSHFVYAAKELINKIDFYEVGETIECYKNEDTNEYSTKLVNWLNAIETLCVASPQHIYNRLCFFICKITGLIGLRQLMILELLNICYNHSYKEFKSFG